jgi:hypothetical protein
MRFPSFSQNCFACLGRGGDAIGSPNGWCSDCDVRMISMRLIANVGIEGAVENL